MISWCTATASAAVVFTAAGLLVGCAGANPTPHPSSPSSPTTTASPSEAPSPANVTLTLSVTSLSTTYGVPGAPTSYPATVRVSVPASSSGQVAAYGVGGTVVLGPSGWTGSGQVGADGGVAFTLAPAGTSPYPGEELVFQFDGACVGCTWDDASAYFPAVAEALPSAGTGAAGSPPPGLQSASLGTGLVGYSLPVTDTELQLNGVAYTNLPASTASPVFENLEISLPSSQHPLATVILNALVANQDRYLCPNGSAASTTSLLLTTGSC
jgi:hypothetical protein